MALDSPVDQGKGRGFLLRPRPYRELAMLCRCNDCARAALARVNGQSTPCRKTDFGEARVLSEMLSTCCAGGRTNDRSCVFVIAFPSPPPSPYMHKRHVWFLVIGDLNHA